MGYLNSKIKILVIGGGSIGQRHIKNLQLLGIKCIYVLKRTYDSDFEEKYNIKIVTSFEQAKNIDFSAVIVATPTALHNEGLEFACNKGIHIFMEKPLIHNQYGLDLAKKFIQNSNIVFFIGFMLRYHPLVTKLHNLLERKVLGDVYNARFTFGSYLPYWHPWEDYKDSYASRSELGGGVINTISHELDLIQYFFGPPNEVFCEASNFGILNITVEEHCEAILKYADKVVTLHLDYLQKDYERSVTFYCSEGKILWNWNQQEILIYGHNAELKRITIDLTFDINQLYLDELNDFLRLVFLNQNKHPLDFNNAKVNTELSLLMHKSAKSGKKLSYEVH